MSQAMTWERDNSDGSWFSRDANNTLYRVQEVYIDAVIQWRWALAWQESDGLRISSRTHVDADAAKAAAEELWSLVPDKMELGL